MTILRPELAPLDRIIWSADAVAIGTVAMVRPWRMRSIIEAANEWDDWDWIS
ncbi:hypothetical protein IT415_04125 [bacterium]|nr:hypothetical protein [bacterium]